MGLGFRVYLLLLPGDSPGQKRPTTVSKETYYSVKRDTAAAARLGGRGTGSAPGGVEVADASARGVVAEQLGEEGLVSCIHDTIEGLGFRV